MQITHRNEDGTPRYTNHLAGETSPYLQQHAHNPVDWYPWGSAALELARSENKPIHLSVGYSACHWCHVLEKESFEDEATARILNDNFVNIKVDREERPDIDRIYQIAQQMLTQRSGGWPLTMFLTHDDQRPFFGGTYFPKEARYGLPAFKDILQRVAQFYRERHPELRQQNAALMTAFAGLTPAAAGADLELTAAPLRRLPRAAGAQFRRSQRRLRRRAEVSASADAGMAAAHWARSVNTPQPDLQALYMATLTLRRMADGGINDQLGGGFCRYSVDAEWMIPHFEKMLYDNGALLAVYADAAVATGEPGYARVAADTADWLLREMQAPQGGYYSSLDADSQGEEGRFYVWQLEELRAALSEAEFAACAARFGLEQPPNFEGHWHLHVVAGLDAVASKLKRPVGEVEALIDSARAKLLALRAQRVRPARDEKMLTSWNALAIRGMAIAARALGREDLAASAGCALEFLRATLWRDGRLLATYMDGRAHLNAYLDDYVYLADAILELQQVRFRADELLFAQQLMEAVLAHFADPQAGGFYFTSDDHEALIHRSKAFGDDATPVRQRHRRARAVAAGLSAGRAALPARRRRHAARGLAGHVAVPVRPREPAHGAAGAAGPDRGRHPARRVAHHRGLAAATCAPVCAGTAGARHTRGCCGSAAGAGGQDRARRSGRLPVPRQPLFGTPRLARGTAGGAARA